MEEVGREWVRQGVTTPKRFTGVGNGFHKAGRLKVG
jgi:hypothetical protein